MTGKKKEKAQEEELSFEAALGQMEEIVKQLEQGELPLEDSLSRFAQGVALSKICLNKLSTAEKQIDKILKEEQGQVVEEIFALPEEHNKC